MKTFRKDRLLPVLLLGPAVALADIDTRPVDDQILRQFDTLRDERRATEQAQRLETLREDVAVEATPAPRKIQERDAECWTVSTVRVQDNLLLDTKTLQLAMQPWVSNCIGVDGINQMLLALTGAYVTAGYIAARPYVTRMGAAARGYSSAQHKTVDTAVAGSLTGKTGIGIQLGTDGKYEGTVFSSTEGPIRIDSDGSLQLRQAINRIVKHDDGTRGRGAAQLNGVIAPAPVVQGGAISGEGQYSVLDSTQTFAVGGTFATPGAVTLNAKGDVVMQGTGVGSTDAPVGSLSITAGHSIVILAGVDTAKAEGNVYGGSGSLKVSARQPAGGLPIKGGASFEVGQTKEDSTLRTGAQWHVRQGIELSAGSDHAAAILLQGLHARADSIKLDASQGGIHVDAAHSISDRDNKLISASFKLGGVNGGADRDYSVDEFSTTFKLDYDKLKSSTYANAQLSANTIEVNSPGALLLTGARVQANGIRGSVGSLQALSMKDDVDAIQVKVKAEVSMGGSPWGAVGSLSKLAGEWGSAAKGRLDSLHDRYSSPVSAKFDFDMRRELRDTVADSTVLNGRDRIDLNVLGTTQLVGAQLQTAGTLAAPDSGRLEASDLASRDRLITVSALVLTPGLSEIKDLYEHLRKDKPQELMIDTGLFRAGGHNTTQYLTGGVEKHSL